MILPLTTGNFKRTNSTENVICFPRGWQHDQGCRDQTKESPTTQTRCQKASSPIHSEEKLKDVCVSSSLLILTDLSECVSSSHKCHIIHCTGRKIGLCATAVKDHLSLLKDRKCLFLYELTFSQGWERKDEVSKLESTPTTLSAQPSTLSHLAFYISAIVPTESVSTSVYQVLAPYPKRVKRSKTWLQVFLKEIWVHFISVNANLCGPCSPI